MSVSEGLEVLGNATHGCVLTTTTTRVFDPAMQKSCLVLSVVFFLKSIILLGWTRFALISDSGTGWSTYARPSPSCKAANSGVALPMGNNHTSDTRDRTPIESLLIYLVLIYLVHIICAFEGRHTYVLGPHGLHGHRSCRRMICLIYDCHYSIHSIINSIINSILVLPRYKFIYFLGSDLYCTYHVQRQYCIHTIMTRDMIRSRAKGDLSDPSHLSDLSDLSDLWNQR